MPLEKALESMFYEAVHRHVSRHPAIHTIVTKFGIVLRGYDLTPEGETYKASTALVNWANFEEDLNFLAAFEEYVAPKLPENFQSVLDVGIGQWTYAFALAAFFQAYNPNASIEGIDNDELYTNLAKRYVGSRNLERTESSFGDINTSSGIHDIVINLNPNLVGTEYILHSEGELRTPANEFYHNIWKSISPDGLFVMGLTYPTIDKDQITGLLSPFFKDIDINENRHATDVSIYPIHYIITAKPKLSTELTQPSPL